MNDKAPRRPRKDGPPTGEPTAGDRSGDGDRTGTPVLTGGIPPRDAALVEVPPPRTAPPKPAGDGAAGADGATGSGEAAEATPRLVHGLISHDAKRAGVFDQLRDVTLKQTGVDIATADDDVARAAIEKGLRNEAVEQAGAGVVFDPGRVIGDNPRDLTDSELQDKLGFLAADHEAGGLLDKDPADITPGDRAGVADRIHRAELEAVLGIPADRATTTERFLGEQLLRNRGAGFDVTDEQARLNELVNRNPGRGAGGDDDGSSGLLGDSTVGRGGRRDDDEGDEDDALQAPPLGGGRPGPDLGPAFGDTPGGSGDSAGSNDRDGLTPGGVGPATPNAGGDGPAPPPGSGSGQAGAETPGSGGSGGAPDDGGGRPARVTLVDGTVVDGSIDEEGNLRDGDGNLIDAEQVDEVQTAFGTSDDPPPNDPPPDDPPPDDPPPDDPPPDDPPPDDADVELSPDPESAVVLPPGLREVFDQFDLVGQGIAEMRAQQAASGATPDSTPDPTNTVPLGAPNFGNAALGLIGNDQRGVDSGPPILGGNTTPSFGGQAGAVNPGAHGSVAATTGPELELEIPVADGAAAHLRDDSLPPLAGSDDSDDDQDDDGDLAAD